LYYTKGVPQSFTRPKIRPQTCRHCGEFTKDYGGYRKYVENGVNLSDIWEDLSPVRHGRHKSRSANELPMTMYERVLAISGTPNGLFVDPFVGSGSSAIAAQAAGMRFVVGDREKAYCDLATERLRATRAGKNSDPLFASF
ncbi:MAG: hypothetical protein JXA18_06795, partial [Chitinispirillaceae bacterium]|nr:hypothetical protein [Chitinispirillaceae bacterium]